MISESSHQRLQMKDFVIDKTLHTGPMGSVHLVMSLTSDSEASSMVVLK